MKPSQSVPRRLDDESTVSRSTNIEETVTRTEDLHVRSYDHEWSYDLDVEIATIDGTVCFRDRFFLQPNDSESVVNAVPPGKYEIRVTLDGDRHEARTCRIGASPSKTAVIEVGNRVVSLSEGFRVV